MNTIKFQKGNVKMVAHRGLSGIELENTVPAFIAAANRSYFGIETDVHKTADGKFILIHDNDTHVVSDTLISVENSSYNDLRNLSLKDKDGIFGNGTLKLASLEEYVRVCRKYDKICVLELKNISSDDDILKITEIVKNENYLDSVIFISFNLNNLIFLRKLYPNQKLQYLVSEYNDTVFEILKKHKLDIDAECSAVTPKMINQLHNENIEINCWTCDSAEKGEVLAAMGVDYITSNILE